MLSLRPPRRPVPRLLLLGVAATLWSTSAATAEVLIPQPLEDGGLRPWTVAAGSPSLSDDGGTLAFDGYGRHIVEDDTNDVQDVFVRGVGTGDVQLVSVSTSEVQANGPSFAPRLSGDAGVVVFTSRANNLVRRDRRDCDPVEIADECRIQVYLRDLQTGVTILVSRNAGGRPIRDAVGGDDVDVSDDGRLVVFSSYRPLDPAYPAQVGEQVYVFDREEGRINAVSVSTDGELADTSAHSPAISGDGTSVTFYSGATNLAPGTGSLLFLPDLEQATTERLPGFTAGMGDISDDGRIVAGVSREGEVLVLDRSGGTTTTIPPVGGDSPEIQLGSVVLSGDGSTLVYTWLDWISDYPPLQWAAVDVASEQQVNHTWEAGSFSLARDGSIVALESDEADRRPCAEPASLWLLDRTQTLPDPSPPVFRAEPDVSLDEGLVLEGVPVRIAWDARDEAPLRFFVSRIGAGGGESEELVHYNDGDATEQTVRDHLRLGRRGLPYAVYACDETSSTRGLAPMFALRGPQESDERIVYEGAWLDRRDPDAWRNGLRVTDESGSSATLSFDGSQVAWIAPVGPDQGSASVSLDGTVVETVDLFETERRRGSVVFRWRGEPGPHTLRIESLGTGRVGVDGFAVVEPTSGV